MSRHRAGRPGRRTGRAVRRTPVLLVVAGALVAGGLADRAGARHSPPLAASASIEPVPVAAPAAAYSSSWFCAGASDSYPNYAAGRIVIANHGTEPVGARVTVVPGAVVPAGGGAPGSVGASSTTTVTVAPGSFATVPETVSGGAGWTGAIVDVDGGSVAVMQVVDGPLGGSASPCATSGSPRWYLPAGQTRINAAEAIMLLNPYPTHSIVDLSFSTDQGVEAPEAFQGLDVPPSGMLVVPLGAHLRRRAAIATTVSARTGNVVAWGVQVVTPPPSGAPLVGSSAANSPLADPASPTPGVAVTLGAPSAGTTWVWPDGLAGNGIDEQYVVYNPGGQTASVRLSVGLLHGSAEPFTLTVGPYQTVPVVSEQQARIPAGVPHTAALVSTNGVPVVAARYVAATNAPIFGLGTRSGIGEMLGERLSATGWMIPAAVVGPNQVTMVIVHNPGPTAVRATIDGLATGAQTVTVPPAGRSAVLVDKPTVAPIAVTATGPVYVESDMYGRSGTPGYGIASAVPLG